MAARPKIDSKRKSGSIRRNEPNHLSMLADFHPLFLGTEPVYPTGVSILKSVPTSRLACHVFVLLSFDGLIITCFPDFVKRFFKNFLGVFQLPEGQLFV